MSNQTVCGRPLICHVAARGSSNQLDLIIRAGEDVNLGGDVNTGADVKTGTDINNVLQNDTPLNLAVYNKRSQEHKQWRIYIVKFWTRAPPWGPKFFQFHAVFGKI